MSPNTAQPIKFKIRITLNTEIEITNENQSANLKFDWNLPSMSERYGLKATEYSSTWKKIHTSAERTYQALREAHIQMLGAHESKNSKNLDTVGQYVGIAQDKFKLFCLSLNDYDENVANAEHLIMLKKAEYCFSAINWHLSNTHPGERDYYNAVMLMNRLCTWCFDTLSRADQVLEKYFEEKQIKAKHVDQH